MAVKRTCKTCGADIPSHSVTPVEMTGRTFGRLTVLGMVPGVTPRKWLCSCSCGGSVAAAGDALRRGLTKSCGCIRKASKREGQNAGTI